MASQMTILARTRGLVKTLNPSNNHLKSISTFTFLSQEPQLAESPHPHPQPQSTPLPPNPAAGSPLYNENWRNPGRVMDGSLSGAVVPLGYSHQNPANQFHRIARDHNLNEIMDLFSDWVSSQYWNDIKQVFEHWIRSLDRHGRPNKPDVNLFNCYLRANLMLFANPAEMLDLLAKMEDYLIVPNTASYNLVLKSMCQTRETEAAEKLLDRMLQTGKESLPDAESYALIINILFSSNQIDAALKYIDLSLKSGYMLSMEVFAECVRGCLNKGKLDILVSIIERCKTMEQSKALCPSWPMSKLIADAAMQEGNSKLAFYALEFMAKWIYQGKNAKPPSRRFVDGGLVVSALATAARTYSSTLLDASWKILQLSLHKTKAPIPEAYLAKICAQASLGNLKQAFSTLKEFESAYVNFNKEAEELFSPFTSLHPLVVACSKNGFETLDSVYYQLEQLSHAGSTYKSAVALNCIIVGCANTWDLDRAYQTFEAINSTFGLAPDINSYNALMYAFGKLKKTFEASKVFEHLLSLGIKPNSKSYALLVDAHLINRDPKAALSVIDEMVTAGFVPSKETLKKVRRRCMRQMDYESDDRVEDIARKFQIRMGSEARRDILFNLVYNTEYAS